MSRRLNILLDGFWIWEQGSIVTGKKHNSWWLASSSFLTSISQGYVRNLSLFMSQVLITQDNQIE
jgi:hypothetical protein